MTRSPAPNRIPHMNIPPQKLLRRRSVIALSAALSCALAVPAMADAVYPNKAVKIVCAFPPGNAADIVARILGEHLARRWGQAVYVENRPGASGIIAAQAVQRSPADGYSLLMTSTSFVINKSVMKSVPYDVQKDFAAISLVNSIPVVLLVRNDFPAKNMAEWVAELKRHADKYSYAHPGVGTIHNLSTKLLLQKTGTNLVEIPYKGSVQALTDIMAGNGDMMFEAANSAFTFVESGKVRALATSGPTRYFALPNVPTMKEAGVDISTVGFTALMAPAQTPKDITNFLNKEVQAVLRLPDVQATLQKVALELAPPMDAAATQSWLVQESERWAAVASSANLTKE